MFRGCGVREVVMLARSITVSMIVVTLAASLGCEDLLPANPYDPGAAPFEQAKGSIGGTILLDDPAALAEVIEAELDAIEVRLTNGVGTAVATASCGNDATSAAA